MGLDDPDGGQIVLRVLGLCLAVVMPECRAADNGTDGDTLHLEADGAIGHVERHILFEPEAVDQIGVALRGFQQLQV
ncbi:hypothetical protein D3C76_1668470 [compost metagenome]